VRVCCFPIVWAHAGSGRGDRYSIDPQIFTNIFRGPLFHRGFSSPSLQPPLIFLRRHACAGAWVVRQLRWPPATEATVECSEQQNERRGNRSRKRRNGDLCVEMRTTENVVIATTMLLSRRLNGTCEPVPRNRSRIATLHCHSRVIEQRVAAAAEKVRTTCNARTSQHAVADSEISKREWRRTRKAMYQPVVLYRVARWRSG